MDFKLERSLPAVPLYGFGGKALGTEYGATSRYLTKNGKPFIYRMGEIHYSRVPADTWEEELIKMRDGGINVIASYVFWIHHEECEGEFNFAGDCDIGAFLAVCKRLDLPFVLRIGPWAHGEAKNGGFPDWLIKKCGDALRTDSEPYLSYVRRFFEKIYEQVKDYSDVIVGIQLENELRRQAQYVKKLKNMLCEIGFSAPLWTFTGWGGSDLPVSCPEGELLFVYGGYPEAPWLEHIDVHRTITGFLFSYTRDDSNIGCDLADLDTTFVKSEGEERSDRDTPYLTCEIGGGNQITYHRRPIISKEDIYALAICKLGSGVNGMGYYMYHGGKNPIGKTTTFQESRVSGYPNDLPIISYDFQSPLGECGQIRKSYFSLRSLHLFLEKYGDELATMPTTLPEQRPRGFCDTETLRCAVRSDGERGYLFVNNHFHAGKTHALEETVKISTEGGELSIPVRIAAGGAGIIPFRFPLGNTTVDWITALPQYEDDNALYLKAQNGIKPEICLVGGEILPIEKVGRIGGKKLILLENYLPVTENAVKVDVKNALHPIPNTDFDHIINYDGTKPSFPDAKDYDITLPLGAKYLKIFADGNIGELFYDGKLISDFYLYGDVWVVDVRQLPARAALTLKILPMRECEREKIYLEYDMPYGECEPTVYAVLDEKVYI